MKRVLVLMLTLLMAMCVLVACGDKKDDNATPATTVANNGSAVTVTIPAGTTPNVTTPATQTGTVTPESLTQDVLVGKWDMALDLGTVFNAYLNTQGDEDMVAMADIYKAIFDGVSFSFVLDFKADNTYSVSMDKAQAESFVQTIFDNTINYMRNGGLEEILALSGEGVTVEQLEDALAAEGMTMDDYYDLVAQQMSESISDEDLMESLTEEGGDYALTADTLFIDMDEDELEMSSEFYYSYSGTTITLLENIDGQTHPFTGAVMTKIG